MNNHHRALIFAASPKQYRRHWWLSLAVVAATAAPPAQAATLPAGTTAVECSADGNSSFGPTECSVGGFVTVPSSALASANLSGIPFVTAEASSPRAGFIGAGAGATALYYFQVIGGNEGDIVPILIETALSVFSTGESSATDHSYAEAKLIISIPATGVFEGMEVCTDGCDDTSLSVILDYQARSGSTVNSVTIYAAAHAAATHFSDETALALADPFIYVDPAFPNASLYSIVVSPGVGNVRVPEPATLWLVGSVLGALSLIRRRK